MTSRFHSAIAEGDIPYVPASFLSQISEDTHKHSLGKVRVFLRLLQTPKPQSHLAVDLRSNRALLKNSDEKAPFNHKVFTFDRIFAETDRQADVCCGVLIDTLCSAVNGAEGCIISLSQNPSDGFHSMIGDARFKDRFGVIAMAFVWLYQLLANINKNNTCQPAVNISALAIGNNELLDVLLCFNKKSDCGERVCQFRRVQQLSEASSVSAACLNDALQCLDVVLQTTQQIRDICPDTPRDLLVSISVQRHVTSSRGKDALIKGQLHLYHLGSAVDSGGTNGGVCDTNYISNFCNTIASVFGKQKHPSCRSAKLCQLLRTSISSLLCQTAVLLHVDPSSVNHTDILSVVQLANRIHRMRRPRNKHSAGSDGSAGRCGSLRLPSKDNASCQMSEPDPSSSEMSADTVIYCGPSYGDFTDGEHPPTDDIRRMRQKQDIQAKRASGGTHENRNRSNSLTGSTQSTPSRYNRTNKNGGENSKQYSSRTISPMLLSNNESSSSRANHKRPTRSELPSNQSTSVSRQEWNDGASYDVRQITHGTCHGERRVETWIDGPYSLNGETQMSKVKTCSYGYTNESKACMVSRWVEHHSKMQQSWQHLQEHSTLLDTVNWSEEHVPSADDGQKSPIMLTKFKQASSQFLRSPAGRAVSHVSPMIRNNDRSADESQNRTKHMEYNSPAEMADKDLGSKDIAATPNNNRNGKNSIEQESAARTEEKGDDLRNQSFHSTLTNDVAVDHGGGLENEPTDIHTRKNKPTEVKQNPAQIAQVDSGVQVSEEDIIWSCRQEVLRNRHSQIYYSNTCLSENGAMGRSSDNLEMVERRSLCQQSELDYNQACKDLSLTNLRLDSVKRLQDFYRELASGSIAKVPQLPAYTSNMECWNKHANHCDSLSVFSEPPSAPTAVDRIVSMTSYQASQIGERGNIYGDINHRLERCDGADGLANHGRANKDCTSASDRQSDILSIVDTFPTAAPSLMVDFSASQEYRESSSVVGVRGEERVWYNDVCGNVTSNVEPMVCAANSTIPSDSFDKLTRARQPLRMSTKYPMPTELAAHTDTKALEMDTLRQPSDYDSGTDSGISMVKTPPRQDSLNTALCQPDKQNEPTIKTAISHQKIQTGSPFRKNNFIRRPFESSRVTQARDISKNSTTTNRKAKLSRSAAIIRRLWQKR